MRSARLLAAVFGLMLLIFCAGALKLLSMRFEAGDIHPPYSSLRADPLGIRAYYEALGAVPGIEVSRNFRSLDRMPSDGQTTLFIAGIDDHPVQHVADGAAKALEAFVRQGGRVVLLLYPDRSGRFRPGERKKPAEEKKAPEGKDTVKHEEGKQAAEEKKETDKRKEREDSGTVSLYERWGFGTALAEKTRQPEAEKREQKRPRRAERVSSDASLPVSLSWHSDRYFLGLDESWQVLYSSDNNAVMIERKFGSGTIVAATDSYFVSNEAVVKERHPALFSWLAGPNRNVVFDESLHGLQEDPGVAALARAYRLEGLFAAFLLLSGLFLWKNATGLGPPREGESGGFSAESAGGRDSLSGLVGLLRRNIPPAQAVKVCADEWNKTMKYRRQDFSEEARKIDAALAGAKGKQQEHPVALYRQISKILSERKDR